MPTTTSALRKLRRDRRRTIINRRIRRQYKSAVKKMRDKPTPKHLSQASSILDQAAKKHVIHRHKASRLKSRLSKLV